MFSDRLDSLSLPLCTDAVLRRQRSSSRYVALLGGDVISNSVSASGGICARVTRNGRSGFAALPSPFGADGEKVLKMAAENACILSGGADGAVLPRHTPGVYEGIPREEDVSQRQILDYLRQTDEYLRTHYPKLAARSVRCLSACSERELLTADGAYSHAWFPRSFLFVSMTVADANGLPVERSDTIGGSGTYSDFFTDPALYYEQLDALYEQVMKKREGVYASAGVKTCVLHPKLTGILAHEAVGHTAEADFVISGSVAGAYRGREAASPMVTLTDFAHTYDGRSCPVPIHVDDEGTAASDAVLIDRGILTGYMHDRTTAQRFGDAPQGNARANAFFDEPVIRMRNTAILPGTDHVEDMIASVEDGYYFTESGNGQADATGEFMFGVTMGYEIKHGKLGRAIRNTTISGMAFDVLKTVDMLSDELIWTDGVCGKKQSIEVGMGGPHLRCRITVGGE